MAFPIIDLRPDTEEPNDQATLFFLDVFRNRTEDWQDVESARQEVLASLAPGRITRVLVDESGIARGWIGGIAMYRGRVWEVHLLVVSGSHLRRSIGQALIEDLERLVTL